MRNQGIEVQASPWGRRGAATNNEEREERYMYKVKVTVIAVNPH